MSLLLAAGCARSSCQSVSVVPTIQCVPDGITKRTLSEVRRIKPVSRFIRSRGITRWIPLEALTLELSWPTKFSMSSLHTPVALTTVPHETFSSRPVSRHLIKAPQTRPSELMSPVTLVEVRIDAPNCAAVRATEITYRASST